jgi:exopolysaccharide production protein ExoQ
MSKVTKHSFELDRVRFPAAMIDKWSFLPILAFAYPTIVMPLIAFASPPANTLQSIIESHLENRIFWPAMAASSVVLVVRNRSRIGKLILPPHIICLLVYLAFAGANALWALNRELSFIRFTQEVMILASVILPTMLAARTADVMGGVFLCFGFGLILNVLIGDHAGTGYGGYFMDKNASGQFAAIAFLLALHQVLYRGLRRALGMIVVVIACIVLYLTNSKTSIGFGFLAPLLAGFTLMTRKMMRISPAIVVFIIITLLVFFRDQVGWHVFNDTTFSARTLIWDFVTYEIGRRPLLGWGYQSFWLIGADSPAIFEAPGWVQTMPNAHNGYLDTVLEMGLVGLALLVIFIMTTLHAIGRVADRDPTRAWPMLSLAIFVIFHNLLETSWMRGYDFVWVMFALVAAETGRCWRQPTKVTHGSRPSTPSSPGLTRRPRNIDSHKNCPSERETQMSGPGNLRVRPHRHKQHAGRPRSVR